MVSTVVYCVSCICRMCWAQVFEVLYVLYCIFPNSIDLSHMSVCVQCHTTPKVLSLGSQDSCPPSDGKKYASAFRVNPLRRKSPWKAARKQKDIPHDVRLLSLRPESTRTPYLVGRISTVLVEAIVHHGANAHLQGPKHTKAINPVTPPYFQMLVYSTAAF